MTVMLSDAEYKILQDLIELQKLEIMNLRKENRRLDITKNALLEAVSESYDDVSICSRADEIIKGYGGSTEDDD